MENRLHLHDKLVSIPGLNGVYFQPPENLKLSYPCAVYSLSSKDVRFANNRKYLTMDRYTVTIISRNPDEPARSYLDSFPYSSFDRAYPADNLHHFVYTIYN